LRPDSRHERGIALLVTLMAMLLLSVLGAALLLTTATETAIAANYLDGTEAAYAADAGIERAMQDLQALPDWSGVLGTADGVRAALMSGFAGGTLHPLLGDGRPLDVVRVTAALNCPQVSPAPAACTGGQMDQSSADRPWGANNPRWHVYAHGHVRDLLPSADIDSPLYLVVWVADDGAETDGDPGVDGVSAANPGRGVILVRAEAFGPSGTRRAVEVTLARSGAGEHEGGYTGQREDDGPARSGRRSAVGTPGRGLPRAAMDAAEGGLR
jgi:Tfp pilus assembly protein PilX